MNPARSNKVAGFWVGKYRPDAERYASKEVDASDVSPRVSRRALEEEVVRFLTADEPGEEEATIKSNVREVSSEGLYRSAVSLFQLGELERYAHVKAEIERRAFMAGPVAQAFSTLAKAIPAEPPPLRAKDDKILRRLVTVEDETSTEDKSEIEAQRPVSKAILTKPSEAREKPTKKAPNPAQAKVTVSRASGKKVYNYPQKRKRSSVSPSKTPPSLANGADPAVPFKPDPVRLAKLLNLPIEALQRLAKTKGTAREFITYFRLKGGATLRRFKLPDEYLEEVYDQLAKGFQLHPDVYRGAPEQRAFVLRLRDRGVTSVAGLATFLRREYRLEKSEARRESKALYLVLASEGAITQ